MKTPNTYLHAEREADSYCGIKMRGKGGRGPPSPTQQRAAALAALHHRVHAILGRWLQACHDDLGGNGFMAYMKAMGTCGDSGD